MFRRGHVDFCSSATDPSRSRCVERFPMLRRRVFLRLFDRLLACIACKEKREAGSLYESFFSSRQNVGVVARGAACARSVRLAFVPAHARAEASRPNRKRACRAPPSRRHVDHSPGKTTPFRRRLVSVRSGTVSTWIFNRTFHGMDSFSTRWQIRFNPLFFSFLRVDGRVETRSQGRPVA